MEVQQKKRGREETKAHEQSDTDIKIIRVRQSVKRRRVNYKKKQTEKKKTVIIKAAPG